MIWPILPEGLSPADFITTGGFALEIGPDGVKVHDLNDPPAELAAVLGRLAEVPELRIADLFADPEEETVSPYKDGDRVTVTLTGTVKSYDGYLSSELANPLRVLPDGTRNHNVVDLDAEGVTVELVAKAPPANWPPQSGDVWLAGGLTYMMLDTDLYPHDFRGMTFYAIDTAASRDDFLTAYPDATLVYRRVDA